MSELIDSYCQRAGIVAAKSYPEFYKMIVDASDKETAESIVQIFDGRADGDPDVAIYRIMNQSLPFAKVFCGGYDGVFLKKVFQRIEKYKDTFGKEVLDVGCNNGFITCFIAMLLPNSHVTGIDLLEDSLGIARALAEELGLNNVRFQKTSLEKVRGKYDTVFLSKISHEIVDLSFIDWQQGRERIILKAIDLFNPYVRSLKKVLADQGTLISIDRIPYAIVIYGYYLALNRNGICPAMDTFGSIHFTSLGDKEAMPFIVCHVGSETDKAIKEIFEPMLDQMEANADKLLK